MAIEKSEEAADSVVTRLLANHRRFLSFLTARVGSREDAEEILQDAFVRGLQKAGEIRDDENAIAWFYRLLRNAVVDYYRRAAAGRKALEAHAREAPEADPGLDADLERSVCECVNDLVPLLKPEYADVIRRVDLGGADVASTADALGISSGNARVRLHRARAALRDELERSCRTCATHGCLDCTCGRTQQATENRPPVRGPSVL
jgi:RNA polymerase sigma factor (sigma-70 family)